MSSSFIGNKLHRDWRNDVEGLGALFSNRLPNWLLQVRKVVQTRFISWTVPVTPPAVTTSPTSFAALRGNQPPHDSGPGRIDVRE